eukprot:135674-Prymnesium_polylepis.1
MRLLVPTDPGETGFSAADKPGFSDERLRELLPSPLMKRPAPPAAAHHPSEMRAKLSPRAAAARPSLARRHR